MSDSTTIMVGLNAALQKRFILPEPTVLIPGNVHRASDVQIGVGGKGQNAAMALSCLSYQLTLQLAQFIGSGPEGDIVWNLLEQRWGHDALKMSVRPSSALRTCTSIVACDETTELVEPSGIIKGDEMEQLLKHVEQHVTQQSVSALCIMGSMPPGCPDETYSSIYKIVASNKPFCLIDSVIGLEPLLRAIEVTAPNRGPTLLKVNAAEFCKLAGIPKRNSETGGILREELTSAIRGFFQVFPYAKDALDAIAITDGKHPAHLVAIHDTKASIYELPVARLETTTTAITEATTSHLFPIGAGDAVAGGTLAAWQALTLRPCIDSTVYDSIVRTPSTGDCDDPVVKDMLTAFGFGLTCGSASCLSPENAQFTITDVVRLHRDRSCGRFQVTVSIN